MNQQPQIIKLEDLTLSQLKEMFYNEMVKRDLANRNLEEIQKAIIQKSNEAITKNQPSEEMATSKPKEVEGLPQGILQEKPKKIDKKTDRV